MRVLPCCAAGADVETFPSICSRQQPKIIIILKKSSSRRHQNDLPSPFPPPVTFDNVAVDGGSELFAGLLVEVLAVDDPHLFEESRLAALAGAE